jgi:hypothetical protein
MSTNEILDGWIGELASRYGWEVSPPENGVYGFLVGDGPLEVVAELPEPGDTLIVYAVVASVGGLDAEGKAALYESVLSRSLFGHETGGAAFGIDPKDESLVVWMSQRAASADATVLESLLERVIQAAESFGSEENAHPSETGESGQAPEDPLHNMLFRV